MTMKRILLVLVVSAFVTTGLFAQCGSSTSALNVAGWQQNVTGVLGTSVIVKFWQVGNMAAANSGTLGQAFIVGPYSTGFYVATDWANTGVVGCPGVGPGLIGTRTALLYSIGNAGAAQYLVMSVPWSAGLSRYDFDSITNGPGNVPAPVAVPVPTVQTSTVLGGNITANLTWTALTAAQLKGFYDAAPANNIITGYAIRYWTGAGAPGTFATGSWTLCPTGGTVNIGLAGTDPGAATVTFPAPLAGNRVYLALSILFDSQTATIAGRGEAQGFGETMFVGGPSSYFGPTAAGLFVRNDISSKQGMVTVDWTTNVETGVASFEVYYSAQKNGSYVPVAGASALPKGNNSSYLVTFAKPVKGQKLFYKVAAQMTDGSTQWSDVLKIVK